jgi:hypothetical protein
MFFFMAMYVYDPLQLFHKPLTRDDITFHSDMRMQAAGIINNYDFDAVILGSSMLANTSTAEAQKLFGMNFFNLSIDGSSFFERDIILNYLLAKKSQIKAIIYSFDTVYISQSKEREGFPTKNFDYLYDNWQYNDMRAYLNEKYIHCLFSVSTSKQCIGSSSPDKNPSSWSHRKEHSARFGGLQYWLKNRHNQQIQESLHAIRHAINQIDPKRLPNKTQVNQKIAHAKKYIDQYFLRYVEQSKHIDFIVIFPPYSRVKFAIMAQTQKDEYEIHKAILQYMSEKDEEFANLRVYAFEDESFLNDISLYKDLSHYQAEINRWMLAAIKYNQGRLTPAKIEAYLRHIDTANYSFDLIALQQEIENIAMQLNATD